MAGNIIVRQAVSQEDRNKVFDIRYQGYKKYFSNREEVIESFDAAGNVILFLAERENGESPGKSWE